MPPHDPQPSRPPERPDRPGKVARLACWAVLALLVCAGAARAGLDEPRAVRGVLDLSGWDWSGPDALPLEGEWELYCGRLLTPGDFAGPNRPAPQGYLALPGDHAAFVARCPGQEQAGATLRLTLLPGEAPRLVSLRLFGLKAGFALWVDGVLMAQGGGLGMDRQDVANSRTGLPMIVRLGGKPSEVVLQLAAPQYWERDVYLPVSLGTADAVWSRQVRAWGLAAFFTGSLLVMGLYHLALFAWRKKSLSTLYFGVYCLLWMVNYACSDTSDWVLRLALPGVPASVVDPAALISFFLSIPVGYRFFRSLYPVEFPWSVQLAADLLAGLYTLLALALPMAELSPLVPVYYAVSSGLIFFCLFMLYRALRHGREGAQFILAGFFILGLAGLNDMLLDTGVVRTVPLIPVGMFVYILFQSFALARLFSRAFTAVETLSSELEENNRSLEEEMAERTRLASEVVTVSEEERRRVSHDLHDGLCQQLTGARLRLAALGRLAPGSAEERRELAALGELLEQSTTHAYDLSRGLWPVEHGQGGAGPSLEELARRVSESSGVAIRLTRELACARCVDERMVQLYRIAQEAVANAVKHARPTRVDISLRCDGLTLALRVQDDGPGVQPGGASPGGLGMRIMAYRSRMIGAEFSVERAPGGGCLVTCRLGCRAAESEPSTGALARRRIDHG